MSLELSGFFSLSTNSVFMKQMCKDHVLCTSKLPHMSVLFEGEITLVLAFCDAGSRTVRNICCRQI